MIQLNDSESLVSVPQVFSDHRARAPWRHTNLVRSPCMGQTHMVDLGGGPGGVAWVGGEGRKSPKIDFRYIVPF